ncbi:MAG: hypothetical protein ACRCX2_28890, partial [Paraclostridium sp.]
MTRMINFGKLFVNTECKFGYVRDKDMIILDNMEVVKMKDLFNNVKEDTRKIKPGVFDFIELQNCFNGHAVITMKTAKNINVFKSVKGIVKSIENGIYNVLVGGENVRVPSMCLKRVPRTIMSKTMKDIFEFMMNKGRNPVILPEYNFMDISEDGKFITYIAEDRLSRFEGKVWDAELRKKYATQKKIRGVLKALFSCTDEEMDSVIMLYGKSTLTVEVLEGEAVKHVFKKKENSTSGSIGQSCMLGKSQSYFDIYAENARVAIVRDDNGLIVLRALIWELYSESLKKKITFLDRIYSKSDSMVPMLINWAMKQGWYSLKTQGHSMREMVSPKGESVKFGDYHVRLKSASYDAYPYIDTLYLIVGNKAYASGFVMSAHSTGGTAGRV